MMGYDGTDWFGMGGFGIVVGVLFMVALVALLVWRAGVPFGGRSATTGPGPLEILRRRYAAGEISEGDYEQTRKTLA